MKRFLSLALALAVPAINVGSLLFISGPVQASDPVILETGKSTTFPTWEAGKKTTLCAQNLRKKGTSIKINAGAAQETLELGGKETNTNSL